MKLTKSGTCILFCGLQVCSSFCHAHENARVHPAISTNAAIASSGLTHFIAETFGYQGLNYSNISFNDPQVKTKSRSPVGWIMAGSEYEDKPFIRGNNHFYDPTKKPVIGLTDGWDFGGKSSFVWATVKTNASYRVCYLEVCNEISYTWPEARAYQFNALTNANKYGRETNLAAMLFYLGHVIHLNQDLTVPAHVRNDNHGVAPQNGVFEALVNWIENFGAAHCRDTKNQHWFNKPSHNDWSWWQNTAGFQKLEDFWNRDFLRTRNAEALDKDIDGSIPLGLSEFCNGNFISEDATYGDLFDQTNIEHWFQFPRLADTTQPNLKRLHWGWGELEVRTNTIALPGNISGKRPYLSKTKSGTFVTNHSALHYEAIRNPGRQSIPQMHVMLTLNDSNVLQEYHSILLPKAVEYSAGILDYFFRATMDVTATRNADASVLTNTVVNTSGQDFYGGIFYLLKDDANGDRVQLQQYPLIGVLTNGGNTNLTYSGTTSSTDKFLLVYQGTVGWTNGAALDLVDSNICIAAARPWIEQTKIYNYHVLLTNLNLTNGATITTNLDSDDFDFVPGGYSAVVNIAYFDDKGFIGCDANGQGGIQSPVPANSNWPHDPMSDVEIPAGAITVVGNHLRVYITATDMYLDEIGWVDVSITWRAWPPPE